MQDVGLVAGAEDPAADLGVLVGEPGQDVEAGLVQLVGRAGGGRVAARQPGVEVVAVGQPAQAGLVVGAAVRDDVGGDGVAVAGDGRVDDLGEQAVALGAERGGVGAAAGGRLGPAERVVGGVGDVAGEMLDGGLGQPAYGQPPGGDAGAVPLGDGVEHGRQPGQPGEVAVGMGGLGDADHGQRRERGAGGREEGVGDGVLDAAGDDDVALVLGLLQDERPRDAVGVVEAGGIDGLGTRGDGGQPAGVRGLARLGVVGEAVLAVAQAEQ